MTDIININSISKDDKTGRLVLPVCLGSDVIFRRSSDAIARRS